MLRELLKKSPLNQSALATIKSCDPYSPLFRLVEKENNPMAPGYGRGACAGEAGTSDTDRPNSFHCRSDCSKRRSKLTAIG